LTDEAIAKAVGEGGSTFQPFNFSTFQLFFYLCPGLGIPVASPAAG
jgi:hypothetical protein